MQRMLPIVAVNGVIDAQVSPLDRGFAYGDGVFETCKLLDAKIPLWNLHRDRLVASCQKLCIPVDIELLNAQLKTILAELAPSDTKNAVVKITLTRGHGGRGYRIPDVVTPTIVIGVFPAANYPSHYFSKGVNVRLCAQRLSCNPDLAGLKHLNRLEQILARAEWNDDAIAEGIMFDRNGFLIEAVFSNIFLIKSNELYTPDLYEAGVAGVMRRFIIETIAPEANLKVKIQRLRREDLLTADAIFLCNSLHGIWPVANIVGEDKRAFAEHRIISRLQKLTAVYLANQN